MTSIVEVIQHYQRSIDSNQNNEARLLHCINKLYNLPIKVEHLQETGVGKTVNSLRKFNGEIGVAAKTLVTKWKAMVAAEEEPMDTTSQTNESETHNDSNGDDEGTTPRDDGEDENHNRNNTSQQLEENKHRSKDKKDKHKDRSSSSSNSHKEHKHTSSSSTSHHNSEKSSSKHSNEKHKSSSSSSSKDKEGSSRSSSKHKDKEREKEKTDHKSHKDKHKESRGGSDHDKEKEKNRSDKKREEKSKTADKEHKLESPNSSSNHKTNNHSSSSKSKHDDKKEKERSDKHKSSSKEKERTKDQEKSSSSSSAASSSSKDKSEHKSSSTSSTSKSFSTKDSDSAERKRRHNSDNDTTDFKSPQPKMAKVHKSSSNSTPTPASKVDSSPPTEQANDQEVADDSFDSSMGANFDDVLGMLNMPLKKSKKSLKSPSTPTASSNSSKKDNTTHRTTTSISSNSASSSSSKVNGTRVPFSSNNSTSFSTPSTSKSSTMKPDLLAPTAKLEPLDPSIALELPTISTNYKPMPLNQTVMDCVFNNSSSSSSSKPVRTLTDAEAITHGISSKTMRTKIYSGVRTGQTFQVPTLFDMCIRILQKNIDALEYTGGVPFEVLKPVLERATPQQLYVFEDYNPYVMEDSDILWQQHVSRNYRTKKRLENESWREMFIRCQEEEERRLSVLKDSIKASQKIAAAPVRKTQLAFVDSMVKPPRNVLKKQEQYGTKSKMVATPAARVASLSSVTPNAAKTGDQRLRVPSTARDHAQVSSSSIRPKKAPLMQKTLQFIRGRHKR
ncbi:transcription elongation factor elongin A [Cochliomyia hominivorax]